MQEENTNTQEPVMADTEMKMPEESYGITHTPDQTRHLGIILGVLIVILMLILGGLYLWGSTLQNMEGVETAPAARPTADQNNEPESTNAEAQVETFQALSTSNEIDAIQADIESTNFDELDAELNIIDAELDAELQAI